MPPFEVERGRPLLNAIGCRNSTSKLSLNGIVNQVWSGGAAFAVFAFTSGYAELA